MNVKRYDPAIADGDGWEIGDASPCMEECEGGDYVRYTSYAALLHERDEAVRLCAVHKEDAMREIAEANAQAAKLDEAVALLRNAPVDGGDPSAEDWESDCAAFLAKLEAKP